MTLIETAFLSKTPIVDDEGNEKFSAVSARCFCSSDSPEKVIGKFVHTFTCNDCYLEEMAERDILPVAMNLRNSSLSFFTYTPKGREVAWGSVSYNKARRLSERETTFLGRLRNRIQWALSP